jgi:hypothetical protein
MFAAALAAYTFVVAVLAGYRSSAPLIAMLLVMAYYHTSPRPGLAKLVVFATLGFAGMIVATGLSDHTDFMGSLRVLANRATVVEVSSYDYIVNRLIPNRGFYLGRTMLIDLQYLLGTLRLVPRPTWNFQHYLWAKLFWPVTDVPAPPLQAPPGLTGEWYANFGLPGVIVGSILHGWFLETAYIAMLRSVKDVYTLTLIHGIQYVLVIMVSATTLFVAMAIWGLSIVAFAFLYAVLFLMAGLPVRRVSIPSILMRLHAKDCHG